MLISVTKAYYKLKSNIYASDKVYIIVLGNLKTRILEWKFDLILETKRLNAKFYERIEFHLKLEN